MTALFGGAPVPGVGRRAPRPVVVFGRDPRDGSRALLEISSLPDVPGSAVDREAEARRIVLARRAAAARAETLGERRADPFERQVERHQRAIARIPAGRDAALDWELVPRRQSRQALDAEVEIERRRLAYDAAPGVGDLMPAGAAGWLRVVDRPAVRS